MITNQEAYALVYSRLKKKIRIVWCEFKTFLHRIARLTCITEDAQVMVISARDTMYFVDNDYNIKHHSAIKLTRHHSRPLYKR
jgi:hypothetical protein